MSSGLRSAAVLTAVVACSLVAAPASADTTVSARFEAVNDSGVRGTADLTAHKDGSLTVVIRGRGYVPGQPHAQHIHGSFGGRHFMCPSMANDANGDGVVTNEEGAGEYGAIFMALTTRGDTSPKSGLSTDRMPVADASGRIDYRRTISANHVPDVLLEHLSEVHVVQHGIDANDNDRYDFAGLGVSTFARNLGLGRVPEEATDPAACGGDSAGVNSAVAGLGGLMVALAALLLARRRGAVPDRATRLGHPGGSVPPNA
jgi:hypothetical protein